MNILVTGGASGIGAAIAARLASHGDHLVYLTYYTSKASADALAAEHGNIRPICCNFLERSSVDALLETMDGMDLNGLVNNAIPGLHIAHFHKMPISQVEAGFHAYLLPVIAITQRAIAQFRKRRHGRIVTVLTSHLAGSPPVGLSEYVASKAYLGSLAKSWAVENASLGITSNCVSPSMVHTRLLAGIAPHVVAQAEESSPLRRLLTAAEVAETVEFLLCASPFINGVNLFMNAAEDVVQVP